MFYSGWWSCWQLVRCGAICFLGILAEAPTINSPTLTTIIQDIMLEITTILNRVKTMHMKQNMAITITAGTITMGIKQTRETTKTKREGVDRTVKVLWVN